MAKQSEQPIIQQPGSADPHYGPDPVPKDTPYQQQPVNQQYFAQPQAAPVQYVVMTQSLKGIKGWLMFFMILFVLQAIAYISVFFSSMNNLSSAAGVIAFIFSPFIAISAAITVVLISMNKKLGRWTAITTIGLTAVSSIILSIVGFAVTSGSRYGSYYAENRSVTTLISGIVITILCAAFVSLYFVRSRRVKETLVD